MKQHYSSSTTRRQWRFLSNRMRQWVQNGRFAHFTTEKQQHLQARLRDLFQRMRRLEQVSKLQKALGAATLLLGLAAAPAQAQVNFGPIQLNPFGLTGSESVGFDSMADIDGDGDMDILSVRYEYNSSGQEVQVLEVAKNNPVDGVANFGEFSTDVLNVELPDPGDASYINAEMVDLDGDGDNDLIVGIYSGYSEPSVIYWENQGSNEMPAFAEPQVDPFGINGGNSQVLSPKFADMDGDGDLDILSLNYEYDYATETYNFGYVFVENVGTSTAPDFAEGVNEAFGIADDFDNLSFYSLGDIDNDGDIDILAGSIYDYDTYTSDFRFYENTGTATSPAFAEPVLNPFGLTQQTVAIYMWPQLVDMDNDGDLDILANFHYDYGNEVISWMFFENQLAVNTNDLADAATQINVYPAVSRGRYTLQLDAETAVEALQLQVVSITGQVLQVSDLGTTRQLQENLDLTALPAGNYYLRLQSADKQWIGKVVKQ